MSAMTPTDDALRAKLGQAKPRIYAQLEKHRFTSAACHMDVCNCDRCALFRDLLSLLDHLLPALAEDREARTAIELPDAVSVKMLQNEVATLEYRLRGCEPYLKDGETPAQCIERNRRDIDALMTLLVNEKRGREQDNQARCENFDAIQRDREALAARLAEVEKFLERQGYRRCDIPACNCPFWHGGHANERLREVSDLLADAGVRGGTTVYGGVLMLRERAQEAEAKLAACEREKAQAEARVRSLVAKWRDEADGVQAMGYSQQADRMRDCADELREALKADAPPAGPEPSQEPGR